jgi:hypothetical protein
LALTGLYKRLEQGKGVSRGDVDAAIRMMDADPDPRLPLSDLPAIQTRRGAVGPRSPGQTTYMEMLQRHEMVFGIGPAGTGKTYLAVAQAVALLQAGRVDRIVLSRPAVEAGERLGFLPGDLKEKIDPYLRPLYDALHDMMPGDQVIRRMASGEIVTAIAMTEPGTGKVAHVRRGSPVLLHLETGRFGNEVVILHGTAEVLEESTAAWLVSRRDAYAAKYADAIEDYGMPLDRIAEVFSTTIVFTPERAQSW